MRKRNHQIIVRLDDEELLMLKRKIHISKPINIEELIDTITKYIKRDQENKEVNSDEKFAQVCGIFAR